MDEYIDKEVFKKSVEERYCKPCKMVCTGCRKQQDLTGVFSYCPNCGAKMDEKEDKHEDYT